MQRGWDRGTEQFPKMLPRLNGAPNLQQNSVPHFFCTQGKPEMRSSAPVLPSTRPLSTETAAPPCQKEIQRLQGPAEQNWKCLVRVLSVPACLKHLSLLYLMILLQIPPAHPFQGTISQPLGVLCWSSSLHCRCNPRGCRALGLGGKSGSPSRISQSTRELKP